VTTENLILFMDKKNKKRIKQSGECFIKGTREGGQRIKQTLQRRSVLLRHSSLLCPEE
jgi:hypothetical protein